MIDADADISDTVLPGPDAVGVGSMGTTAPPGTRH